MTKTLGPIAALVAVVLAVAGCGSSNDSTSGGEGGAYSGGGTTTTEPASTPETSGAVVSVATVPKLGKIIVDSRGFTLYDFHKDKGTTSSCYGGCAQVWPPLLTKGAPQAGNGAPASKLGTTTRKDGTVQVTFAGHPVYTYVQDKKPGDTTGNDFTSFGAQWYALEPNGEEAGD